MTKKRIQGLVKERDDATSKLALANEKALTAQRRLLQVACRYDEIQTGLTHLRDADDRRRAEEILAGKESNKGASLVKLEREKEAIDDAVRIAKEAVRLSKEQEDEATAALKSSNAAIACAVGDFYRDEVIAALIELRGRILEPIYMLRRLSNRIPEITLLSELGQRGAQISPLGYHSYEIRTGDLVPGPGTYSDDEVDAWLASTVEKLLNDGNGAGDQLGAPKEQDS